MLFKVAEATVKATLRSSYANHYRSRLIKLLSVLEFCSNNTMHRPVLDALELIGKYAGANLRYYPPDERVWGVVPLIDIVKEAVLRTGCLRAVTSVADRGHLAEEVLVERLLLAIYAYGTNTGIRAVAGSTDRHSEDEIRYARRRYLNTEAARRIAIEIATVVVHSQLLDCSASEVHAMVDGAIHHGTEMTVSGNYVDTHGQSEIGFGITKLLGLDLLPRIKRINKVKLYRPAAGEPDLWPGLKPAMTRPINRAKIGEQYDQMLKYTTAIRTGSASTEAILRRFMKANSAHPTYQAMIGLGRAQKAIWPATCAVADCNARSTTGSTSSSPGTEPTASSSTVRTPNWPPTAATNRRSRCCACGSDRPPWSTSTP
ncbi:Tn3 family transposase [Nocardia farcinica]